MRKLLVGMTLLASLSASAYEVNSEKKTQEGSKVIYEGVTVTLESEKYFLGKKVNYSLNNPYSARTALIQATDLCVMLGESYTALTDASLEYADTNYETMKVMGWQTRYAAETDIDLNFQENGQLKFGVMRTSNLIEDHKRFNDPRVTSTDASKYITKVSCVRK
jgi:hypothetical protein